MARENREERLALNQTAFREINDRVEELLDRHNGDESVSRPDFLCECASDLCLEHVSLTLDEYRHVRASAVTFAVRPSEEHVYQDIERVTTRNSRYWIVEKQDRAAQVVRAEAIPNDQQRG